MNYRKTEQSMHKRVAYRLRERGFRVGMICAVFDICPASFYKWISHTTMVIK